MKPWAPRPVLPCFYVIFPTILPVHRAFRDEERCSAKYGDHCKIIPGII